jgi:3-deoxy-D-manno-octulosonate 8-phosphate phosphatase (KDO 8-P phosphatase)
VTSEGPGAGEFSLEERICAIRLVAFDFDGVFTDNSVYVFQDGSEAVRCYRGDGIGLRRLEALGVLPLIISTEANPVVTARSYKLGIRCVQNCDDKLATLKSIIKEVAISKEQVAFVGNDVNDLDCLRYVGLSIVVNDAHTDVIPYAHYRTKVVGGYGAVREICDLFDRVLSSRQG